MTLRRLVLPLLALFPLLSSAGGPPLVEAATLTPTFGGVLLNASFRPRGKDTLSGAWYEGGRAKLMRCDPHCTVVSEVALDTAMMVGQDSLYRVVLAGKFKGGQRLKMVLRFSDTQLVTLNVPIVD
ncbi:hypothetical protein [Deinococcus altitudinis]|uniref:hypothetical protein n=1 Tax=Deinococcus altitudinis TaxID=468914 RepID=UPI0038913903